MYKHDEETLDFLANTKRLLDKQASNIVYIFKTYEAGKEKRNLPLFLAANFFSVGSEMLAYQIWKNLENGYLLISLLGLRVLLENLINVRFIYVNPEHMNVENWADNICEDFLTRSHDDKAKKSQLGEVSLYKRSKAVGFEDLYQVVYSELCDYSHFLANSIDVVDPLFYKGKTIDACIYVVTCYYDILSDISSYVSCAFESHIEEIKQHKQSGIVILKRIRKMQDERKAQLEKKLGNKHDELDEGE